MVFKELRQGDVIKGVLTYKQKGEEIERLNPGALQHLQVQEDPLKETERSSLRGKGNIMRV